jgi:cytochrome c biogenesis protein CcmG, thiol:disulfide interchange protein DsbE
MHPEARRAVLRGTLALLACGGLFAPRVRARALRIGQPAPPAVLTTLDGQRISTQELIGNVVILTFWATYCVPCRAELPLLSAYAAQHAAQGLRVLGFSLDEGDQLAEVRKIAAQLSFPNGLLTDNSAPGYGRIWRMPANFTIDRDGRLVDNAWDDKQPSWTPERFQNIIAPLLARGGCAAGLSRLRLTLRDFCKI